MKNRDFILIKTKYEELKIPVDDVEYVKAMRQKDVGTHIKTVSYIVPIDWTKALDEMELRR